MSERILIIEDDLDLCEVLQESFEDEGYLVSHLQNGLRGQRELLAERYDFLILDIKIPGLNGFDILAWLRKSNLDIKIIVLTGMPLNEEITRYLKENDSEEKELLQFADAVINKPVDTSYLLQTLASLGKTGK